MALNLSNGIDIAVATNSFRSVRGRPVLCAILDETAFWRDESSANPDQETFNAIKPGLAELAGFAGHWHFESVSKERDCCIKKFRDHYGKRQQDARHQSADPVLNPLIDSIRDR